MLVELDVGLSDDVLVFLPRGQVERPRLGLSPASFLAEFLVGLLELFLRNVIAWLELRVAAVDDAHVFNHATVADLAIRSLDEAKLVDAREAREARDESDVWTFRSLNRADASVVCRVHVAHFEPGALARETAWSKCRETALVRDLGERIRLVHELRQLARAEELTHRRRHRLGVDEIARHRRLHFLVNRHLLLDRAFHAFETDAELVFQQLTDRAHASIAKMIDVVRLILRRIFAHLQHVADDFVEVRCGEKRIVNALAFRLAHLDVELQASYTREVKLARIEEHRFEQSIGSLHGRRIARTHLAINLEQRIDRLGDDVFLQRQRQHWSNVVSFRKEDTEAGDTRFDDLLKFRRRDFVVRFENDLAALGVDDVGNSERAFELRRVNFDFLNSCLAQRFECRRCDLLTAANYRIGAFALDVLIVLHAHDIGWTLIGHLDFQVSLLQVNLVGDVDRANHVLVSERGILHGFFEL